MATDAENLAAARTVLIRKYMEAVQNPKPNYSIEGQSVSWEGYLRMLREEIEANTALQNLGVVVEVSKPVRGW